MNDLIERLRLFEVSGPTIPSCQLCGEAADEIEQLQSTNYELQFALNQLLDLIAKLEKVVEAAVEYIGADGAISFDQFYVALAELDGEA